MSALSPKARAAIDAVRERPTPADRERVRAALATRLGVAIVAPSSSAEVALGCKAKALLCGASAKSVAGGLLVVAMGVGSAIVGTEASGPPMDGIALPAPSSIPSSEPRPPAGLRVDSTKPLVETRETAPERHVRSRVEPTKAPRSLSASSAPSTRAGRATPRGATLLEEAALLREAQGALLAGDARRSLEAIARLEAQHPTGILREERLATGVLGLCAAGRVDEARVEGQRFIAEMPRSLHADRIRRSCAFTARDR